jgi:hypothetical protein
VISILYWRPPHAHTAATSRRDLPPRARGEPVDAGVIEPPDAGAAIASTELDLVAPPRIKGSPGVKGSLGTKAMGALLGKPLAPPTKVIKSKKPMSKKEPDRGP